MKDNINKNIGNYLKLFGFPSWSTEFTNKTITEGFWKNCFQISLEQNISVTKLMHDNTISRHWNHTTGDFFKYRIQYALVWLNILNCCVGHIDKMVTLVSQEFERDLPEVSTFTTIQEAIL